METAGVVYGRTYGGNELRFEASGGLVNAALVMRDKETGSYWPILRGEAETGPLAGTRLEELRWGTKTRWRDWVRAHPGTRVLSVRGVEHVKDNVYDHYFTSGQGFGRLSATDSRLPTKEPVWAFERDGVRYAVPLRQVEGGATVQVGGRALILYRPPGASVYLSTRALEAAGRFAFRDGAWRHEPSGAVFDPERGRFSGGPAAVQPSPGLDTFWCVWSLTHPETEVLRPAS